MKNIKNRRAQSVIEYLIFFGVVVIAIFSSGLINKMRDSFYSYFDKAANTIVAGEPVKGAGG